jgi:hypothetical protein
MSGKLKSQTRGGNFARKSLGNVNQSISHRELFRPNSQRAGQWLNRFVGKIGPVSFTQQFWIFDFGF